MKRLLQLMTLILLATIFGPLGELFDQWDEPGVTNDTAYPTFAFFLAICLVLLVCVLIAAGLLKVYVFLLRALEKVELPEQTDDGHLFIFIVPPLQLVPLRI